MASVTATKLPEVESYLSGGIISGVVGVDRGSGDTTFQSRDPGSGDVLAEVHAYTAADVNRSVDKANEAFKKSGWSTLAPNDRGVRLHRFADLVEQQKEVVSHIEAIDAGKLPAHAMGDVENFIESLRFFADMAQTVQRRNQLAVAAWHGRYAVHGVCGFIFPNFQFFLWVGA